jgi:hypothetical protein
LTFGGKICKGGREKGRKYKKKEESGKNEKMGGKRVKNIQNTEE